MLAISLDAPGQLAAVRAALQGYGVAAALSSQAAYDGYGRIWRVPTTFVIDREGVVRHAFSSQIRPKKHVEEALRIVRSLAV